MITILFKSLSIEKKLLVILASIAISIGVLGMTDLVFNNQLAFIDTIYKSLQFFIGEFEYSSLYKQPVPPMINVARFLALFVSFGLVFTIIVKQKIYALTVRLFYRDVVIITDESNGFIEDLAGSFAGNGRKVISVVFDGNINETSIKSGEIPRVSISTNDDIKISLKKCNVKNSKDIYLLCRDTSKNVTLLKAIYEMISPSCSENPEQTAKIKVETAQLSINELIKKYIRIKSETSENDKGHSKKGNNTSVSCYIHYQTDEERKYYALDRVFTNRTDDFSTYFINRYDISIRQMLTQINIAESIGPGRPLISEYKKRLENLSIGVCGSGEMLSRTIAEISKSCVFNSKAPLSVFLLTDEEQTYELTPDLKSIVKLIPINIKNFAQKKIQLELLFICSEDEKEIQSLLERIFQFDMQTTIGEYLILTQGNEVEYSLLMEYIKGLLSPYKKGSLKHNGDRRSLVFISNIKNLIPQVSTFYKKYAPSAKQIQQAYNSAFSDNEALDYSSLPERFIDSNILSSMHTDFIISILDSWIDANRMTAGNETDAFLNDTKKLLGLLAAAEHERWYNERVLHGFVYSEEKSRLYYRNNMLKHWSSLSESQKNSNIIYVLNSSLAKLDKGRSSLKTTSNAIERFTFERQEEDNEI